MISINLKSPHEIAEDIGQRAKTKRLKLNMSQKTLSEHSGVSYSTLKKFEQSGKISLESLLKIALTLDELDQFEHLFVKNLHALPSSIDELPPALVFNDSPLLISPPGCSSSPYTPPLPL